MTSKVSSKGQVVIPNPIRKKMNIKEGTIIEFKEIDNKRMEITLLPDPIEELEGILKGVNLTKLLQRDHKEEIQSDEIRSRRLGGVGMDAKGKRISKGKRTVTRIKNTTKHFND